LLLSANSQAVKYDYVALQNVWVKSKMVAVMVSQWQKFTGEFDTDVVAIR